MAVEFPDIPIPHETGPVVQSLMRFVQDVHRTLWRTLECLYAAEMDWKPAEEGDSIGTITEHVIAAERNWLDGVLLAQPPPAASPAAQAARSMPERLRSGVAAEAYLVDLAVQYQRLMAFMAGLTDDRLSTTRRSRRGRDVTVEWVLHHLIQHVAYHTGQVVYITMLDRFPD
jgi:uncharacterized damage-inducible protein DinB